MEAIFIVGSPRTGTHWLRRVLAEHDSIVSNPYESHVFPLILGPFLHSKLPWNRSWRMVNKNFINSYLSEWITKNDFQLLLQKYKTRNISNQQKAALLAKSILDHYYNSHKTSQSRFLLEKSPNHIYYLNTITGLFENVKIIELIRHPVEVIKSLKTLMLEDESWVPKSLNRQIDIWIKAVQAGLQYKMGPYSPHMLTLKYENLVNDFEASIHFAADFLSIAFDQKHLMELGSKFQRTGKGDSASIEPLTMEEYLHIRRKSSSLCEQLGYRFKY